MREKSAKWRDQHAKIQEGMTKRHQKTRLKSRTSSKSPIRFAQDGEKFLVCRFFGTTRGLGDSWSTQRADEESRQPLVEDRASVCSQDRWRKQGQISECWSRCGCQRPSIHDGFLDCTDSHTVDRCPPKVMGCRRKEKRKRKEFCTAHLPDEDSIHHTRGNTSYLQRPGWIMMLP